MSYIKRLDSGWLHIRLNNEVWAQVPPGFSEPEIPNEYIFQPTREKKERLSKFWQEKQEKGEDHVQD